MSRDSQIEPFNINEVNPNSNRNPSFQSEPSQIRSSLDVTFVDPSQQLPGGAGSETLDLSLSFAERFGLVAFGRSVLRFFGNHRNPCNTSSIEGSDGREPSLANNFSIHEPQLIAVEEVRNVPKDYPAAYELLMMEAEEICLREKITENQREIREIREPRIITWSIRVQKLLSEGKEPCKQLFELIKRKRQEIQDYCAIRRRQLRGSLVQYRAITGSSLRESVLSGSQAGGMIAARPEMSNFKSVSANILGIESLLMDLPVDFEAKLNFFADQYKQMVKSLEKEMKNLEKKGKKQDQKVEKEKKKLLEIYKGRKSLGDQSLFAYELLFIREVRKQYENVQSMKQALLRFINDVKKFEELEIRNIIEEIENEGENLKRSTDWEDFSCNDQKPLVLIEKEGLEELKITVTADGFLVIYEMNENDKEPKIKEQFKIYEISGKRDRDHAEILLGFCSKTKKKFKLEFRNVRDLEEFLECFKKFL